MSHDNASRLLNRFNRLKTDRRTYEHTWQTIVELVLPQRGDFTIERAPGSPRGRRKFDSTAVQSNEFLAATLHGGLTTASIKWFALRVKNQEINDRDEIKNFLEIATNSVYDVLNNVSLNFQSQNHEVFLDATSVGTATMFVDETIGEGIRFKAIHLAELYLAENKNGQIDTVFREFKFTARQAAQMWGIDKLPKQIREKLEMSPDEKFNIIHCVKPNEDFEVNKVQATKLPFVSYYLYEEGKETIEVGGYHEMPYLVFRFSKLTGEIYGRSPANSAYSDILMINVIAKILLIAQEKRLDPPLLMADDGVMLPLRTQPGGVNYGGLDGNGQARIQVLPGPSGNDFNVSFQLLERTAKAIRNAYHIDPLLNSEPKSHVTREEIIQRQSEKLKLLGPQVGRIQSEYLSPLIKRIYGLLQRNGTLPKLSDELSDLIEFGGLEIEYTTPLSRSQRSHEPEAFRRLIEQFAPIAQLKPEIFDNAEFDTAFRTSGEILGVPYSMFKSTKERDAIREERAKAQQAAQQQQQLTEGASSVAELTKAGVFDGEEE